LTPVARSASVSRDCGAQRPLSGRIGGAMDENEHPKGALLFTIVYLLLLAGLWLNVYLRLW